MYNSDIIIYHLQQEKFMPKIAILNPWIFFLKQKISLSIHHMYINMN